MYSCSICKKEVVPPTKCCEGGTIYCYMSATASGEGSLCEVKIENNNLTEQSAMVVKQMMSIVLGTEFFKEEKEHIFANDIVIEDSSTGRRFSFTLTAKEI